MSYFKTALELQRKYLSGEIRNLPAVKSPVNLDLSKFGHYVNVGKATNMLIGGLSGSGKTGITDSEFVLKLFLVNRLLEKPLKIRWLYWSMERKVEWKIAKWICYFMYIFHGIRMDVPTFYGWDNKMFTLTSKHLTQIEELKKMFEEELEPNIEFFRADNPTGIRNTAIRHFMGKGIWYHTNGEVLLKNKQVVAKFKTDNPDEEIRLPEGAEIKRFKDLYFPNDEAEYTILIMDHIGKLKGEKGYTEKQLMDKHGEYMSDEIRDIFGGTVIDIQQFNRSQDNVMRKVKLPPDVYPGDYYGTSTIFQNADIVLGLINPIKSNNQIVEYMGYDVTKFIHKGYNRLRVLKVLKNSFGIDDVYIGYGFLGESGFMREIPPGSEMTDAIYSLIKKANLLV